MSICLALDTATEVGSVAVGDGDTLIAEVNLGRRRSAKMLLPAIEECLRLGELTYDDLAAIAVADGPGSFTGLRVAFATAQGILAQRDLPVYVAPSLMVAALTAGQPAGTPVAALYNALRGEVFAGVFSFSSIAVTVHLSPRRVTMADLVSQSPVQPRLAVGDGVVIYAAELMEWTGHTPVGPPLAGPRASSLLMLKEMEGGALPIGVLAEFEPDYGRKAEAQVRWEEEHGRPLPEP
jgi:tRNA threonylcarbamoyladenosine biosynthesis protein TsaB